MNKPFVRLIMLVLLVVLVAGGVAYGMITFLNKEPQEAKGKPLTKAVFSVGDFTTNLVPEDGKTRFIRVKVEIEIADEKNLDELAKNQHAIRDQIIGILRSKTVGEVSGEMGMAALRQQMAAHLNFVLKDIGITNVYFTDFVVQ